MSDQWYYGQGETKLGPFSAQQLKEMAAQGKIEPAHTIWKEGIEQGVPATRVKNLFPASQPEIVQPEAGQTIAPASGPSESPSPPEASPTEPAVQSSPSPVSDEPEEEAEPEPREKGAAPPKAAPAQPKKGRALGANGAVIVSQDGYIVYFRKKCIKCGYEDLSKNRMPIRSGTTRTNFFCPKCRKIRPVEIQSIV